MFDSVDPFFQSKVEFFQNGRECVSSLIGSIEKLHQALTAFSTSIGDLSAWIEKSGSRLLPDHKSQLDCISQWHQSSSDLFMKSNILLKSKVLMRLRELQEFSINDTNGTLEKYNAMVASLSLTASGSASASRITGRSKVETKPRKLKGTESKVIDERAVKRGAVTEDPASQILLSRKTSCNLTTVNEKITTVMLQSVHEVSSLLHESFSGIQIDSGDLSLAGAIDMHKKLGHQLESNSPVFGVPLHEATGDSFIPPFLERCVRQILSRGLGVTGIIRISGDKNRMDIIQSQVDFGGGSWEDFDEAEPIHNIAGLLRRFLCLLPEPLCLRSLYKDFIDAFDADANKLNHAKLLRALDQLPGPNIRLLDVIMGMSHAISQGSAENLMSASAIAIVFAPAILQDNNDYTDQQSLIASMSTANRVVENMIVDYTQLFTCRSTYGTMTNPLLPLLQDPPLRGSDKDKVQPPTTPRAPKSPTAGSQTMSERQRDQLMAAGRREMGIGKIRSVSPLPSPSESALLSPTSRAASASAAPKVQSPAKSPPRAASQRVCSSQDDLSNVASRSPGRERQTTTGLQSSPSVDNQANRLLSQDDIKGSGRRRASLKNGPESPRDPEAPTDKAPPIPPIMALMENVSGSIDISSTGERPRSPRGRSVLCRDGRVFRRGPT